MDNAELPTTKLTPEGKDWDFTLFLVTKKSKAGAEDYAEWSFRELRTECSARDSIKGDRGNYGSSDAMRKLLIKDDKAQAKKGKGKKKAATEESAAPASVISVAERSLAIAERVAIELGVDISDIPLAEGQSEVGGHASDAILQEKEPEQDEGSIITDDELAEAKAAQAALKKKGTA